MSTGVPHLLGQSHDFRRALAFPLGTLPLTNPHSARGCRFGALSRREPRDLSEGVPLQILQTNSRIHRLYGGLRPQAGVPFGATISLNPQNGGPVK